MAAYLKVHPLLSMIVQVIQDLLIVPPLQQCLECLLVRKTAIAVDSVGGRSYEFVGVKRHVEATSLDGL